MLKPISTVLTGKLEWVQPKTMQRMFELRAGDHQVATLEFKSAFGSLAVAASADGRWTFKRVGFFNPRVTVRREGDEQDLAVYRPKWTGNQGTIKFADGQEYSWNVANFWATRYVISEADGEALVTYQSGVEEEKISDLFKSQARVVITPQAAALPELALLVLLGWYLIILAQEDSTAVAATVAATAT